MESLKVITSLLKIPYTDDDDDLQTTPSIGNGSVESRVRRDSLTLGDGS